MKNSAYLAFRITLIVLIACTLIFTFYQSSLSKEESSEASAGASSFLEPIIPSDTPVGEFVHTNIREIAHFTEFAALGLFVSLYAVFFMPAIGAPLGRKYPFAVYSFFLSVLVALLDETVQIFTGRGPEIVDVWLDVAGFATTSLAVWLTYIIIYFVKARRDKTHSANVKNG